MIEITLIIAVVIINSPFQPGDFCTGFTAGIQNGKYGRRHLNTDEELSEDDYDN